MVNINLEIINSFSIQRNVKIICIFSFLKEKENLNKHFPVDRVYIHEGKISQTKFKGLKRFRKYK